jgi:Zn ribbon nucleic-acid-binding protein
MIFSTDSTIRFSRERGFSECFTIICPICCNASITVVHWEDGTEEITECLSCKRREETRR